MTASDTDHRIIDAVSIGMQGRIGTADDTERLVNLIVPTDPAAGRELWRK
jgi:hypothetical protein